MRLINSTTEMTKDQVKSKMTKLQYDVYQRGLRVAKYRVNTNIDKK